MTDTWLSEDLPFLRALRSAEDEASPGASLSLVANLEHFAMEEDLAIRVALRLGRADYLDFKPIETMVGVPDVYLDGLTEKGRRAVGQWPSEDPWAGLVDLLSRQIEDEVDPVKKTKMVKIRDGLLAAGRDVSTSLLKAYIQQQAGL